MLRIEKEREIIGEMIAFYCKVHHSHGRNLCDDCNQLLMYAHSRLDRCPFGNKKPSCRKCAIHCYSPAMKSEIRKVMRYVGPRMIIIHPLDAIWHLYSELR